MRNGSRRFASGPPGARRRQWLALVVMVIGGGASLATGAGPGNLMQDAKGQVAFARADRVEVRHARVTMTAGSMIARSHADIVIHTGGIGSPSRRPVVVTVVRDSDGASIGDDHGPDYPAPFTTSLASSFVPIALCERETTCTESFTVTFTWVEADDRDSLAFDWTLRVWADRTLPEASPPGDTLTIEISE